MDFLKNHPGLCLGFGLLIGFGFAIIKVAALFQAYVQG